MAYYQLTKTQLLKASMNEVWDFISSPQNLKVITPDHMGFQVTSDSDSKTMYPGMIITYKVSPLLGIKMDWMTEITHVSEKNFFVDEQRLGPYKLWHHQHKIKQVEEGVLMTDIVTYIPPYGLIGRLANSLFIKKQLEEIFAYRNVVLHKMFNSI